MEAKKDLFEHYEELPQEVQDILTDFDEDANAYDECKKMENRLNPLGYTFEWGLDGVPFNLQEAVV